MSLRFFFAWYDLWVGAYWSRQESALYVCLLPCVVLRVQCRRPEAGGGA